MARNGKDGPGGVEGAFGRRLLLTVDAKGYGSADTQTQREFQEAIRRLWELAADAAGLDHEEWMTQEGGDSLFAVLPEGSYDPDLVDNFMRVLYIRLRGFNRNRKRRARLRLRAAIHYGSASPGANGFIGDAPVEIGRILDCAALRAALDQAPDACLAVGLSATVFRDVVQGEVYTTLREDEFRQVRVKEKEYNGDAWIWLPGADVRQLDLRPAVLEGERRDSAPVRSDLKVGEVKGHAVAVRAHGAVDRPIEATTDAELVAREGTLIGVDLSNARDKK
jgi:class 3 adenylate cyclase